MLREPSLGYSSNYDEAMFGIQKASFNVFWKYSPTVSANLASDWLKAENSTVDEDERKTMDDEVARYFTRFGVVVVF